MPNALVSSSRHNAPGLFHNAPDTWKEGIPQFLAGHWCLPSQPEPGSLEASIPTTAQMPYIDAALQAPGLSRRACESRPLYVTTPWGHVAGVCLQTVVHQEFIAHAHKNKY